MNNDRKTVFKNLLKILLFCIVHTPHSFSSREVSFFAPVTRCNAACCKCSIIDVSCLKQLSKIMAIMLILNQGVCENKLDLILYHLEYA